MYKVPENLEKGTKYQDPNITNQELGPRFEESSTKCQKPSYKSQVPGTSNAAMRKEVPGTRFRVPGTMNQASRTRNDYQVAVDWPAGPVLVPLIPVQDTTSVFATTSRPLGWNWPLTEALNWSNLWTARDDRTSHSTPSLSNSWSEGLKVARFLR